MRFINWNKIAEPAQDFVCVSVSTHVGDPAGESVVWIDEHGTLYKCIKLVNTTYAQWYVAEFVHVEQRIA